MSVNTVEGLLLAVWGLGLASALWATTDRHLSRLQRITVVVMAAVLPVVGSLVAVVVAVLRVRRLAARPGWTTPTSSARRATTQPPG
ncbi:hypothetical protein [Isoptericola sp. NPDC058082]|uniref:hypothetical protein n=1 Tax=Isoptericola sp. NPDC058082 TaxID=3346331 RepID=UPI0036EF8556